MTDEGAEQGPRPHGKLHQEEQKTNSENKRLGFETGLPYNSEQCSCSGHCNEAGEEKKEKAEHQDF